MTDPDDDIEHLRRPAEEATDERRPAEPRPHAPDLLHELEVHQTELELQNRALRESRQQLEEALHRYADLYDLAPVGYVTVDPTGEILEANLTAAHLLGVERSALRGTPLGPFLDRASRARLHGCLRRGAAHGSGWSLEAAVGPRGRPSFPAELRGIPWRDHASGSASCRVTIADVTERKDLEAQLLQAQKMEAVGQLAGGIAHDFRNQLTVIIGFADLLLEGGSLRETERRQVQQILAASARARTLTSDLLSFSRKDMLHPEPIDLVALVRDLARTLPRLIREDIRLSITAPGQVCRVVVDRGRLQHAIMNLVVNAGDSMPSGGTLTIEVRLADETPSAPGGQESAEPPRGFEIRVSDTGEGMDEATRVRAAEPFFTTKQAGEGSGLGLSMVYGYVRQSGGDMEIRSRPGEGTTVRLWFPAEPVETPAEPIETPAEPIETPAEPVETPAEPASAAPGRSGERGDERAGPIRRGRATSRTILVVEDDEAVRKVVVEALVQAGYDVRDLPPGRSDEERRRALTGVDLLVIDVVMPWLSGPRLVDEVRRSHPTLPVLFISGYPFGDLELDRHGSGPVQLLTKPFSRSELLASVSALLESEHEPR